MDLFENENLYGIRDLIRAIEAGDAIGKIGAAVFELPIWGIVHQHEVRSGDHLEAVTVMGEQRLEEHFAFFFDKQSTTKAIDSIKKKFPPNYNLFPREFRLKEIISYLKRYEGIDTRHYMSFDLGGEKTVMTVEAFYEPCNYILQQDARSDFLMLLADMKNGIKPDASKVLPFELEVYIAGEYNTENPNLFHICQYERDGDPVFEGDVEGMRIFLNEDAAQLYVDENEIKSYKRLVVGNTLFELMIITNSLLVSGIEVIDMNLRRYISPENLKDMIAIYEDLTTQKVGSRVVRNLSSAVVRPHEQRFIDKLMEENDWIDSYEILGGVYQVSRVEVLVIKPKADVYNLVLKLAAVRNRLTNELAPNFLATFHNSVQIAPANRPIASPDNTNIFVMTKPYILEPQHLVIS